MTTSEAFWAKVDKTAPGGCWVWTGTKWGGYGKTWTDASPRKRIFSHVRAYQMLVGPVPEGMDLDHLCRNRACCNPAHLEPVTHHENVLRGYGLGGTNARKTHCAKGHEYTPENTIVETWRTGHPTRICRECRRQWVRDWYTRKHVRVGRGWAKNNTHCKRGHEFTAENTIITKGGTRLCRACDDLRKQARRAANKSQASQYSDLLQQSESARE